VCPCCRPTDNAPNSDAAEDGVDSFATPEGVAVSIFPPSVAAAAGLVVPNNSGTV
jgi:hypothetical protein